MAASRSCTSPEPGPPTCPEYQEATRWLPLPLVRLAEADRAMYQTKYQLRRNPR